MYIHIEKEKEKERERERESPIILFFAPASGLEPRNPDMMSAKLPVFSSVAAAIRRHTALGAHIGYRALETSLPERSPVPGHRSWRWRNGLLPDGTEARDLRARCAPGLEPSWDLPNHVGAGYACPQISVCFA